MKFGSIDGGEYGDHNGVGFVLISKMIVMQDAFFLSLHLSTFIQNRVNPRGRVLEVKSLYCFVFS